MRLELVLVLARRAAHVVLIREHANRHDPDGRPVLGGRHRVDGFLLHHLPLDHVLRVDDRGGARNGDRLFQRADAEVGVHVGGELRLNLDALALDGREPSQGEGDGVHAGTQVDDVVAALRVG